jgi:hypothetical protein
MKLAHESYATVTLGERTFKVCFDLNSLSALEEQVGRSAFDEDFWPNLMQPFTAKSLLLLFWAGLRTYHPEITLEEAGSMITVQNAATVMKAVQEAERAMNTPAAAGA